MSIRSTHSRAPAASSATIASSGAVSVSTVRLWTSSVWRSSSLGAAERGRDRGDRVPVEAFGEVRDRDRHLASAGSAPDDQLAGAHQRLAVDADVRLRAPRSRGGPAPGPCRRSPPRRRTRRGQVPRIFSSSSTFAGELALSLVPIPSSATLVPPSPPTAQQLHQALALGAGRRDQVAALDRQLDRLVGDAADRRDRAVDDQPCPRRSPRPAR